MATGVPFDCLAEDLGNGLHDFSNDTLKVFLTNSTPDAAANAVYSDLTDLATSGGYTAGGASIGANTWSQSGGVASLVAGTDPVTFTATSGFGPFRYAVLYNFTATGKNLIAYWDKGTSSAVAASGSFTFDPGAVLLDLEV